MLNKVTLQFKDKQLEVQYQNYQNKTHRLPMFKHISMFALAVAAYFMVIMLLSGTRINQILSIALFIATISLMLLVKRKENFARGALIILNHLLIITSVVSDNECSPHYYYLRGMAIMAAHMIIAMSGEFLDSMFSILSIFIVRMLLLFLKDNIFPFSTVLIAILIPVYIIYSIYKTNQGFRSQFQLACIDSQWDKILTTLIDGAYLLIEFNPNQMQFNCKRSNRFQYTCNNQQDLKDFLRNNFIENKAINLEKFFCHLFQSQISTDQAYILQQTIAVKIEDRFVRIQYSVFFGHRPMVLLQICKQLKEELIQEEKFDKIENLYQSKYKKLLKFAIVKMKKIIHQKNDITLFKKIFYSYLQENLKSKGPFMVNYFNLQFVLNIIKQIYKNKKIIQTVAIPNQVLGNKFIVCKILIDILESQTSHIYKISFHLIDEGQSYQIQIDGMFNLNKLIHLKNIIKFHDQYLKDIIFDQTLIFSNEIKEEYFNAFTSKMIK